MKRKVLAIPLDEVKKHFDENSRQDIKIVVPRILEEALYSKLKKNRKGLKPERPLDGEIWVHSERNAPNWVCETCDFDSMNVNQDMLGFFTISFANESAEQDSHYYGEHWEIYYSEHPIRAEFSSIENSGPKQAIQLDNGGALIFGPGVIHKVNPGGLTLVIEIPAMENDKEPKNL